MTPVYHLSALDINGVIFQRRTIFLLTGLSNEMDVPAQIRRDGKVHRVIAGRFRCFRCGDGGLPAMKFASDREADQRHSNIDEDIAQGDKGELDDAQLGHG